MKVWGGLIANHSTVEGEGAQIRVLVKARSKKAAVKCLNEITYITMYYFNDFWSETGNPGELAVMEDREEGAMVAVKQWSQGEILKVLK